MLPNLATQGSGLHTRAVQGSVEDCTKALKSNEWVDLIPTVTISELSGCSMVYTERHFARCLPFFGLLIVFQILNSVIGILHFAPSLP